jgi:GT2 family glycosyltransferase
MDHYTMRDVGYETSYDVPYMSGCFMLFRREILERIGGFDERFFLYLEDADITLRAAELSRAIYLPNVVITHSWNRGGHKTWRLTWVTIVSAYRFFSKWGWKWI